MAYLVRCQESRLLAFLKAIIVRYYICMLGLLHKMPKSEKEHKSVKYLQNVAKRNQVIFNWGTACMQNILILAQAIFKLFCSQGSIGLQCISRKRGITLGQFRLRRNTEPRNFHACSTYKISKSYL